MNKSNNRHMNIFDSYTQSGNLPIENNISRGLAIILQEYPSLLMILISKINEKNSGKSLLVYPQSEYRVDFQRSADSFELVSTIVGITLTASEIESVNVDDIKAEDRKYITDISIVYDDTLVFVEVKRTGENCFEQLKEQIEKYKASQSEHNEISDPIIVDLTWTDIVELLKQHKKLFDGNPGRLCDDYLYFLINKYPSWNSVERLSALSLDDEEAVLSRLEQIKIEYIEYTKSSSDTELMYGRAAIPLNKDYVSECNLKYEKDFKTQNGKQQPCVTIGMWPADIGRQYWNLKGKINKSFFENRFYNMDDLILKNVEIRIVPYVKFSHFQRGIIWLKMKEGVSNFINEWLDFADKITGRKKKDNWDSLKESLLTSEFFSEEAKNNFKTEFGNKFEGKKSYVDISCGFEVKAYIPFSVVQEWDKKASDDGSLSKFAVLLNEYINWVLKRMTK